MTELQHGEKRVGLHSAVFRKLVLQTHHLRLAYPINHPRVAKVRLSLSAILLAFTFGLALALLTIHCRLLSDELTARQRAEEEIRIQNAQLNAANRELEAFSYSVSHDL